MPLLVKGGAASFLYEKKPISLLPRPHKKTASPSGEAVFL